MHVEGNFRLARLGELGRRDGSPPGDFAAAADPFLAVGGLFVEAMLVELPRPIGLACTRRPILAKFNPELLLRH